MMSHRILAGLVLAALICFGPTIPANAGGDGACCRIDGTCSNGVDAQDCLAPAVWHPGLTCAQVRCDPTVPTVSDWGLAVLALLLAASGKVYFSRRRAAART
jgi:hypothetical protein